MALKKVGEDESVGASVSGVTTGGVVGLRVRVGSSVGIPYVSSVNPKRSISQHTESSSGMGDPI